MATQVQHDKIRAKVLKVRETVKSASNDQIILVLQYYENDVEKTVTAFLEDNAKEALQQWQMSGASKTAAAKKKKKKKRNKLKTSPTIENGDASSTTSTTNDGIDSMENTIDVTTPISEDTDTRLPQSPVTSANSEAVNGTVDLFDGSEKSDPPPVLINVAADSKTKSNAVSNGFISSASKVVTNSNLSKGHRPVTLGHIEPSAAATNEPLVSRPQAPPPPQTPPPSSSSVSSRPTQDTRRPQAVLERSCKDLHRQTVSLERLGVVLGDNVDKAFKRVSEVFKELHHQLDRREKELTEELTATKINACEVISQQQLRATSLKHRTERAHTMPEHELAQLRTDIKQFLSERKLYEDLSNEQRFTCDISHIFDNIAQFGEVTEVKVLKCQRQMSTDLSDATSCDTVSMPDTPCSQSSDGVAAALSSLHVVTQSDSLTQYEREKKQQQLTSIPAQRETDGTASAASHSSAGGPSVRGGGSPRGRGSPRRGGTGQQRSASSSSRSTTGDYQPSHSRSRTFFSRTIPSMTREFDLTTDRAAARPDDVSVANNSRDGDASTPQQNSLASGNLPRNFPSGGNYFRGSRSSRDGRGRPYFQQRNNYRRSAEPPSSGEHVPVTSGNSQQTSAGNSLPSSSSVVVSSPLPQRNYHQQNNKDRPPPLSVTSQTIESSDT